MKFDKYYKTLDAAGKKALANRLNTSLAYIYMLASGHRKAGAKILFRIETATDGQVTPDDLRPDHAKRKGSPRTGAP